jgi:hypothetical protein
MAYGMGMYLSGRALALHVEALGSSLSSANNNNNTKIKMDIAVHAVLRGHL